MLHHTFSGSRRRGVVAVMVTMCLLVIIGFAALTVDVGFMYNARNDLQRTADSAALAAAALLSEFDEGNTQQLARDGAVDSVRENRVLGRLVQIDPDHDVTFLRAQLAPGGDSYLLTPDTTAPNAVRVDVALSEESPNGPLALFFANAFGKSATNVSASAVAMMMPRDIAIAADISASKSDDSELENYRSLTINLWDVWNALPGGANEIGTVWDPEDIPPGWVDPDGSISQAAGPGWGFMKTLGYGNLSIPSSYDPAADPGLAYLPYRVAWSNAQLTTYLADQGYSVNEINAIMNNAASDTTTIYPNRVAVALGLASWNSGMPGGRWSTIGQPAGNGNTVITATEMVWNESLMGRSVAASSLIFTDYIRNYTMQTSTSMYDANPAFRYRYGIKTFVNYLLEDRPQHDQTPEFANAPVQPMQAVKDATQHMMDVLIGLDSDDQVSLEVFATTGRHEVNLTSDFPQVSGRMHEMQAAYYDRYTNVGAGLERAIEELSGPRARAGTAKIIVLYSDGSANINAQGQFNSVGGHDYALAMASEAAARGYRIYAVSVGAEADIALMNEVAARGHGQHFHAEGTIEQYSNQLDSIFQALGSRRNVQLIQ